ncbi:unnamed protein product [Merluccius merluccius]
MLAVAPAASSACSVWLLSSGRFWQLQALVHAVTLEGSEPSASAGWHGSASLAQMFPISWAPPSSLPLLLPHTSMHHQQAGGGA